MRIGVIGAGAWGTALGNLLACKGYAVDLWAHEEEVCLAIAADRENKIYLPGVSLAETLNPSTDLDKVASGKDMILMVVPSHVFRSVATRLAHHFGGETLVVSATKGIENESLLTMSEIMQQLLPQRLSGQIGVLSGPSFAEEVGKQIPTAVTVAARSEPVAKRIQVVFAAPYFRVYTSYDVLGLELGGAVKNVMAIAAGISDGLGLGYNTRAALITRGLAEIQRLGVRMGAHSQTFMGLAGMGDLVLTCTGPLSRNWSVGQQLGKGKKLGAILGEMRHVAEGVRTAQSVHNLSQKLGVEMPIAEQVYRILYEGLEPKRALRTLMSRDLRPEHDEEGSAA